jgi:hypothetical protein
MRALTWVCRQAIELVKLFKKPKGGEREFEQFRDQVNTDQQRLRMVVQEKAKQA